MSIQNQYVMLANQTVDKIRELIDIKNTDPEDMPLLINRVTSGFAKDWLQRKLNGEEPPEIDLTTLQLFLEGEIVEGNINQYVAEKQLDPDPRFEQYQVVITPRVAAQKILTTIRVRKNA